MALTLENRTTHYFAHESPITSGVCDGVNTIFTLAKIPNKGTLLVRNLSGLCMRDGSDYTRYGATLTFTVAPDNGDLLTASYDTLG